MNKNRVRAIYCIILGLVVLAAGIIGTKKFTNKHSWSIIPVSNITGENQESGEDELSFDSFTNISVNTDVAEIRIETGKEYKVYYEYLGLENEGMCPVINVEKDTLVIKQKTKTVMVMAGTVNRNCKIVITVPEGTDFDNIDIYTGVGDVRVNGISAEKFSAETDVGEVEISKGNYGKVTLITNVGDASFFDAIADLLDVTTDVGEINITKTVVDEARAKADVGDVELLNVYNSGNALPHLNLDTDVGSVKVNGEKEGQSFHN